MDANAGFRPILFLTHNYPRHQNDFAGRFLAHLAELVVRAGHSITVLAPHHPGALTEEDLNDVRVVRFRYAPDEKETLAYRGDLGKVSLAGPRGIVAHTRFFRAFGKAARQLLQREEPGVLHAHWWIPAGLIARGLPFHGKLIVTLHGTDLRMLQSKAWLRPLAARVFRRASIVTVVSSWLADSLTCVVPSVSDKLRVIPMPPNDAVFHPDPADHGVQGPPTVLCVTRFTAQKRNNVLLEAFRMLSEREVSFRAKFIGEGPQLAECKSLAQALGLADRVTFANPVPQEELAWEYRRSHVVALPAVDEGFGMTLVEAQLCGTAVVGVRSGGITDIIEDERSGLMAHPDDSASLAGALDRLLSDGILRNTLAHAGMRRAQEQFSASSIVSRFCEWYRV